MGCQSCAEFSENALFCESNQKKFPAQLEKLHNIEKQKTKTLEVEEKGESDHDFEKEREEAVYLCNEH